MIPELKNPLRNAKVVGANILPTRYHSLGGMRGDASFVMSKSQLFAFGTCPKRWLDGYVGKDTDATEWGSLMDILVTSPTLFESLVAVCPSTYPADGKKGEPPTNKPWTFAANYCKDWRLEQGDKLIVKHEDYQDAKSAIETLYKDEEIATLIRRSTCQVMVTSEYYDDETAITVPIKCLIDLVPDCKGPYWKSLCDFKTTTSAHHEAWIKTVWDRGYHWQAALYLDAYAAATGEDRCEFRHIVQESFAPWHVSRELMSEDYLQVGRLGYLTALREYCQCLSSNQWPGYKAQCVIGGWNLTEARPWMITANA